MPMALDLIHSTTEKQNKATKTESKPHKTNKK
jgi:hypothetical protein